MKKPNITPGEWTATKSGEIQIDPTTPICRCFDNVSRPPGLIECEANTKAIAAIPALLAALESAYNRSLEWVQNMELIRGPHSPEVEPSYLEVCEIRDEYKAALESAGYDFSEPEPEDAEGHAEKSAATLRRYTPA